MLPLLALFFAARGWPEFRRIRFVWAISASYVSLFGLLLWQALRGQSVTAPDASTLTAMTVWAVLTVSALAIAGARRESARVHAIVY
jgi:hypothetical protein